ncbi:MAG: PIN/TRAM domain-containing protein [Bacillaceae bacterium]|nr:PIN/TRAM domain-containing protein [Bacillaceae bacterium]
MIKRIIQIFFLLLGGGLGYQYGPDLFEFLNSYLNLGENIIGVKYITAALGATIFLLGTSWLTNLLENFIRRGEERLIRLPITDVLFGSMGLIIGLIVAFLLYLPIQNIELPIVGNFLPLFLSVLLGYLGFNIAVVKRDEIVSLFSLGRTSKDKNKKEEKASQCKILDTSVIIDGRIADVCQTGFIEGTLIIPGFVLEELQHIADSSDVLKRNRGRRGLDILNKIQKELKMKVEIYEGDFEEIQEVDSKLVKLAKVLNGKVITNDFNLNKVCELQGVDVLNINDLANAVKPVVLPGEELNVQVIKDGKEHGQGIGYLDDGTMIVVEGGREHIGSELEVLVTSVLQTSAGRMIFAKPKMLEKAL